MCNFNRDKQCVSNFSFLTYNIYRCAFAKKVYRLLHNICFIRELVRYLTAKTIDSLNFNICFFFEFSDGSFIFCFISLHVAFGEPVFTVRSTND